MDEVLNDKQIAVLRRIAEGSPEGVMHGDAHKVSAAERAVMKSYSGADSGGLTRGQHLSRLRDVKAMSADGNSSDQEVGPTWAWALCAGWRGPPELLAQTLRAAVWALEDSGAGRPTCNITITVGEDVERFASYRTFQRDVTKDALTHFDSVRLSANCQHLRVSIRLIDKQRKDRPWLKRGMLVEVWHDKDQSLALKEVRELRDRVLAAVKRGFTGVESAIRTGDSGKGVSAQAAYLSERAKRRRRLISLSGGMTILIAVYLVVFWRLLGENSSVNPGWLLGSAVGGAVLGLVPVALLKWIKPSIEVSEVTKSQRLTRVTLAAIGPVLGGALALIARLLGSSSG